MAGEVQVEVIYILPDNLFQKEVSLSRGSTVADALSVSGIFAEYPELEQGLKVGIFGKVVDAEQAVRDGDRVEVYRPLIFDPKEARRQRALKKSEEQKAEKEKLKRTKKRS